MFDPNNYVQNVLTAARELQQVTNQITSLQNQATSLVNQARNLANLPYSLAPATPAAITRTQQLLGQAQGIGLQRPADRPSLPVDLRQGAAVRIEPTARHRCTDPLAEYGLWPSGRHACAGDRGGQSRHQPHADIRAHRSEPGRDGALQAAQAGNQLLALQAQQLADLTAVLAANGRAQALQAAEQATAVDQGRVQRQTS